ncbi:MAG TPA: hypothetical protein VFX78_10705 [Candidatus Eisenbacteria bacterium]|nr:hypothetical protein [Candidatus Eisenbacteria bacterium]
MTERRGPALLLLAFLLGIGAFYSLTLRPGHDWGDDFAQYIHHAKNIATGVPYGQTGYIWNPGFPMLGPPTYPPVFPLMLAPVVAASGLALAPMKGVVVASFVLALLFVALVFRSILAPRYLAVLLVLLGLNPYFWNLKDNILSDVPFLLFVYIGLYLIQRRPGPEEGSGRIALHGIALGVAFYLAYGTRSLGIVLVPCAIAAEWLSRRRVGRGTGIAVLVFATLAALQAALAHKDSGYTGIVSVDPRRIALNFVEYARYLSGLWNNAWWGAADTLVLILVFVLAAMGFLARLRAKPGPLEIFAVLYGLAILPWIATQGRYLIPLMPLYVGYALWAVQVAAKHSPARGRLILAGLLVLTLAGFSSVYLATSLRRPPEGVGTPDAIALWGAVDRITGPGDVVIFQKPRALALFANRSASGVSNTADDEETWRYFESVRARYAILGPDDHVFLNQDRIRRLVEARPERFERVYENPEFTMYRVRPDGEGASGR